MIRHSILISKLLNPFVLIQFLILTLIYSTLSLHISLFIFLPISCLYVLLRSLLISPSSSSSSSIFEHHTNPRILHYNHMSGSNCNYLTPRLFGD
ncbi:hypothetical protein BGX38DRAFT_1168300 [Terfezia claveryi]|nr:hypothetical protein BGX38DRAFT_1168300 [Terfezia claveryi]